jgi:uncharacterized protein (TIGR02996 family)
MSYADAFLQTILESPDDDAPRLVFADWLEERGDPRGEFIRIQCQLAQLAEDDFRCPELEARERALLHAHRDEWERPLRQVLGQTPGRWWFRRGFIEEMTADAGAFLAHAETVFRLAPLRHVCLSDAADHLPGLAALPLLDRLTSLDFYSNDDAETLDLNVLAAAGRNAGLAVFRLYLQAPRFVAGLAEPPFRLAIGGATDLMGARRESPKLAQLLDEPSPTACPLPEQARLSRFLFFGRALEDAGVWAVGNLSERQVRVRWRHVTVDAWAALAFFKQPYTRPLGMRALRDHWWCQEVTG